MNILLAEDDARLASLIVHMLKKERYSVEWVDNGTDAIYYAQNNTYDLLILDWMMPGKSGIEVCRLLREQGYQGAILLLTAKDALDDRVTGLDAGADDYLVKPFAFQELFARLRALTRRGKSPLQEKILQIGTLQLHVHSRKVYQDGEEIYLTPKEFQLLELLLRNRGQVIPREVILERVWGYDSEVTNNNIDAYVRLLRKKLGKKSASAQLKNVRGIGYVMED